MTRIRKSDGWCAAVALQYLSGLPEKTVLDVCRHEGFDPFHGMEDSEILAAAKDLGLKLKPRRLKPQRLRAFIKKCRFGLFLVGTYDHVFVIRDGLLYDPMFANASLDRIVRHCWRVS